MNPDAVIIDFVIDNPITAYLAYKFVQWLCNVTPWAWDNSIPSLLLGGIKLINPIKKDAVK